jgi:hypothetical protein
LQERRGTRRADGQKMDQGVSVLGGDAGFRLGLDCGAFSALTNEVTRTFSFLCHLLPSVLATLTPSLSDRCFGDSYNNASVPSTRQHIRIADLLSSIPAPSWRYWRLLPDKSHAPPIGCMQHPASRQGCVTTSTISVHFHFPILSFFLPRTPKGRRQSTHPSCSHT